MNFTKNYWLKLGLLVAIIIFTSSFLYRFGKQSINEQSASSNPQNQSIEQEGSNLNLEEAKKTELIGKYSEEITFDKPIDVAWEGKIIATFHSGTDYGIEKTPKDENYPYFYAGITSNAFPENVALDGKVEVTGKWTGITCAYQNTIFKRCVPDVGIRQIRTLETPKSNGETDWSQPFEFFTANFSKDNYPDVYQEIFTGGAHCCFRYKAFIQTSEKSIFEIPFDEIDHPLWPKDVNNDGIDELVGSDSTFDYWNACYADSQAPEIILSFNAKKSEFDLNTDLMKKPAPSQEDLEKKIEEIRSDREMNSRGNIEGFPSPLWGYMLDLIYSGNEKSAWEFLDLAWPKSEQEKAELKKDFQDQLKTSPYFKEISSLENDIPVYHTKKDLCASLSPQEPNANELKYLKEISRDPFVKHLRKSLNVFLSNKKSNCYKSDCFDNELGAYDELAEINTYYLKSKFIVLQTDIAPGGGASILVLFKDKPDQVFYAWVYDYHDGKYDLRGFSKFDKADGNVPVDIQKIQKTYINQICNEQFGI